MKITGKVVEPYSNHPIQLTILVHKCFDIYSYNEFNMNIVGDTIIHNFDFEVYTDTITLRRQIDPFLSCFRFRDGINVELICDGEIYQ